MSQIGFISEQSLPLYKTYSETSYIPLDFKCHHILYEEKKNRVKKFMKNEFIHDF